ncbi:MAG: phosphoadenosine phosphosulfate reductase family protein [Anaerovoracaceae bacterium]
MKGGDDRDATRARGRAGRRVIREEDYLRGRLAPFRRRVDRALALIGGAAPPLGVAFSGGKDSTVVLDLVRRVFPDAVAGFYDSGAELADTMALVSVTPNVVTVPADGGGLIELCRQNGYWGHEPEAPSPCVVDFGEALIFAPARRFAREHGLHTVALGLRAGEAVVRRINARVKGEHYQVTDGAWHLCPLQWWTGDDVWAYIASRDLPYNAAYDKMDDLGIPRERQRISTALGTDAAAFGRYVYLKHIDPELWNRLAAEFPLIRKYT